MNALTKFGILVLATLAAIAITPTASAESSTVLCSGGSCLASGCLASGLCYCVGGTQWCGASQQSLACVQILGTWYSTGGNGHCE
jgi:hypothetical protein